MTFVAHSVQRQSLRLVAHTSSKAGLRSFTKNFSKSLVSEGILVNCLSLSRIVTASFTDRLSELLTADGFDASDPVDVMRWIGNVFHQPADLGRVGLQDELATDGGSDFM